MMIGEFLLHLPFREKCCFLWVAGVMCLMESLGRETTKCLKEWRGTLVKLDLLCGFILLSGLQFQGLTVIIL